MVEEGRNKNINEKLVSANTEQFLESLAQIGSIVTASPDPNNAQVNVKEVQNIKEADVNDTKEKLKKSVSEGQPCITETPKGNYETAKTEDPHESCDFKKVLQRRKKQAELRKFYSEDLEKLAKTHTEKALFYAKCKNVFRMMLNIMLIMLNVLFIVLYIVMDYTELMIELSICDFCVAIVLLIEYLVNYFQSGLYLYDYAFELSNLSDFLTFIAPVFHILIIYIPLKDSLWHIPDVFSSLRVLRFYRTLIKLFDESKERNFFQISETAEELIKFALRLFVILIISAGLVHFFLELVSEDSLDYTISFWDAVYFCIVTFSTIGFGCIRPTTTLSKYFVIALILFVLVLFANQVTGLSDSLRKFKSESLKLRKGKNHIIIYVPSIDIKALIRLLNDYYSLNNDDKTEFLVLSNEILTDELTAILLNPRYNTKCLGYLTITELNKSFIEQCNIANAKAIFILSNQNSSQPEIVDSNAGLFARIIHEQYHINVPTFIAFAESDEKFETEYDSMVIYKKITAVNLSEIKYKILAKNIFTKGYISLIECLLAERDQYLKASSLPSPLKYKHSINHTEFSRELPEFFEGLRFEDAVMNLYKGPPSFAGKGYPRILLIGVVTKIIEDATEKRKLLINPYKYKIKTGDIGYMLYFKDEQKFNLLWSEICSEFDEMHKNALRPLVYLNKNTLKAPQSTKVVPVLFSTDREEIRKGKTDPEEVHDLSFNNAIENQKKLYQESDSSSDSDSDSVSQESNKETEKKQKSDFEKARSRFKQCLKKMTENKKQVNDFKVKIKAGTTIALSTNDLRSKIEGHIVICGFHNAMRHFIDAVREISNIPICFIFEDHTPPALLKIFSNYTNIYHFQGSPSELSHLNNAACEKAFRIIVLTTVCSNCTLKDMRDSRSILIARLISLFFPRIPMNVELKEFESLELLDKIPIESQRKLISYCFWPNYMIGDVFISNLFDMLPCRCNKSPGIARLIEVLSKNKEQFDININKMSECSNLYSFQIPECYTLERMTYETLFSDLLASEIPFICLGIYPNPKMIIREEFLPTENTPCEFTDLSVTEVPLLFLNPPPETRLRPGDNALCIGLLGVSGDTVGGLMTYRGLLTRRAPLQTVRDKKFQEITKLNYDKLIAELNERINGKGRNIEDEIHELIK